MITSAKGRLFISRNEWKPRSKICGWDETRQLYFPYKDYKGFWTFGIGHLLGDGKQAPGPEWTVGRTEAQVDELFASDLKRYEQAVLNNVTVPLEQNEFDALVDFCFNEGTKSVLPSQNSAIRALNEGKRELVPALLLPWDKTDGVHDAGLKKRRQAEGYLFTHPYPVENAPLLPPPVENPPNLTPIALAHFVPPPQPVVPWWKQLLAMFGL